MQGGSNLTYSVEVTTQDGIQIANVTNTNQTYALLKPKKQPSEPLFVQIWAENNFGKSGSRSFIISSLGMAENDDLDFSSFFFFSTVRNMKTYSC